MNALPKRLPLLILLVIGCSSVLCAQSDTALFEAVKSCKARDVGKLLAAGAKVNAVDDLGNTPLFYASVLCLPGIAERLIVSRADVGAKGESGFTALHAAAYQNCSTVTKLLVGARADVNARSEAGWTPLHKAIEKLANPDTAQTISLRHVNAAIGIVALLLANGADPNSQSEDGSTPLLFAALSGQEALVNLLVSKGADVNAQDRNGKTALHMAAHQNRIRSARLLLVHGAEVNSRDQEGTTALHIAAETGNKDLVELLVAHGADVNAAMANAYTPLLAALELAILDSPHSGFDADKRRTFQKDFANKPKQWHDVAMFLVANGADTNAVSKTRSSSLLFAVMLDDKALTQALLDHGADIDGTGEFETPLHAAIAEKNTDIAELLITRGANVNSVNMSNRTPLHFLASYIDDPDIAEQMIKKGAQVNARGKDGRTPLGHAVAAGNDRVAKVLRKHGGTE